MPGGHSWVHQVSSWAPKRRDIHCSECRGFLQSPWLFQLLSPIVGSIVKMASVDYLSRHWIENTLISTDVSSIHTLFNISLLPLWHWQVHRTPVMSSIMLLVFWTNFFWTRGHIPHLPHPTEYCVPASYLKHPTCSKVTHSPPKAVGVCWPWWGEVCGHLAVANRGWAQPCWLLCWLAVCLFSQTTLSNTSYGIMASRDAGQEMVTPETF